MKPIATGYVFSIMNAIMAMSKNRCIGKDGKLPWPSIKKDFQWFKEFTLNKSIVIGRKTYETLPILKHRTIWVLSNSIKEGAGALCATSTMYHYVPLDKLHIIPQDAIVAGGKSTYNLCMPNIKEFYVTIIDKEYEGDTYMFEFEHLFNKYEVIKEFDNCKVIRYYDRPETVKCYVCGWNGNKSECKIVKHEIPDVPSWVSYFCPNCLFRW